MPVGAPYSVGLVRITKLYQHVASNRVMHGIAIAPKTGSSHEKSPDADEEFPSWFEYLSPTIYVSVYALYGSGHSSPAYRMHVRRPCCMHVFCAVPHRMQLQMMKGRNRNRDGYPMISKYPENGYLNSVPDLSRALHFLWLR